MGNVTSVIRGLMPDAIPVSLPAVDQEDSSGFSSAVCFSVLQPSQQCLELCKGKSRALGWCTNGLIVGLCCGVLLQSRVRQTDL